MKCSSPNCECNRCQGCSEQREHCECELIEDTRRLLDQNDYTYEDFAHSARYLLERWVNGK